MFFEELTISLSKAILIYENNLIMGNFNIDVKSKSLSVFDHFAGLALKGLSYRNHKNFDESTFLNDLNKKTIITFDNQNPNRNYNVLSNRFLVIANVHRRKCMKNYLKHSELLEAH